MSTKLSKAAENYLNGIKIPPITKWVQVNSIEYMKNFFTSNIGPDSVTKSTFITDGFDRFLPIAQVYVLDAFSVELVEFVRLIINGGKYADCVTGSFTQAVAFYKQNKDKPVNDKKDSPSLEKFLHEAEFNIGGGNRNREQDPVMDIVFHWEDKFNDVKNRLVDACDYILENCVDAKMVKSDLAQKKFPKVIDFFNLDKPAAELMKFCYTFRATGIKLPRDVQNFEDRMRQLS